MIDEIGLNIPYTVPIAVIDVSCKDHNAAAYSIVYPTMTTMPDY
jgi:hypothetical protein